ncbi:unnamed protein product [Clonostachys rhizophaga]|uniref:Transcription factor domain-containing protein n=1 Tax=Clonostachys rhizophaga TaxID=160324 RepID=A0A9N9YQ47_9HYPO|nr:unnamed protein product [Clonostachys rhizophaga]
MPPLSTARNILRRTGYADVLVKMIRKTYGECPESSAQGQPLASFDVPDPTAHPIAIARNLLLIALSLQIREEVTPSSSESQSSRESSHRYFSAATHYVTSKDQLVTSPVGLETLMLEGLYQLSAGNLKLGWLTFCRAIECADLDGNPAEACMVSTSSFLWFRLNYSDRILSLIMGLPFATLGDGFASPEVLAADVPVGRVERMHTVVMGHIIARNQRIARAENTQHALRTEAKETRRIDEELFQVSTQFPRKWWLSPHLENLMPEAGDSMHEMLRLLAQVNQAHLLLALHLPHAIHAFSAVPQPQPDCSYSTIQASRDLLARFVLYRKSHRMPVCCRVIGFKAFTASASLLLAHIDGHHLGHGNTLRHHRQEDLGVIEMAVDNIKDLAKLLPMYQGKAEVRILEALIGIEARLKIDSRGFSGECSVLGQGQPFEFGTPFLGRVRIHSLATAEPADMTDLELSTGAFEIMPSTMSRDAIGGWLPQKLLPLGYLSLSISGSLSAVETVSTNC